MSIIENAKEIAELVKKYNDQDLYQRIVELREEILALREENLGLREQVSKLRNNSEVGKNLVRDGNAYFLQSEVGERKGPFCLACWDYENKLVNLKVSTSNIQGRKYTSYHCNICTARKGPKGAA